MADPAPMAAPAPPPAKRKKEDPTRLQTSLLLPPTAAADWSALPPDLVRRVADSLLATNDLDCYMHLRAACPGWRAATDDPKDSSGSDRRFEPRRWILQDEVFQSEGEEMLLVNADTGRFLRRKFPMLRDQYAVAATHSGYLVLADKSPPHAASVLNPLTGAVVRFLVPVPPQMGAADVVFRDGPPLKLVFICNSSHSAHYTASPDSHRFTVRECGPDSNFFLKAAVSGGVYASLNKAAMVAILIGYLGAYSFPPDLSSSMLLANVFSGCTYAADDDRGFLVGLDGDMLLVFRKRTAVYPASVLRFDARTRQLVLMWSIGRFAIFVGHRRCVAVDADKFPGVEPNCVYFTRHLDRSAHIWKYNFERVKVISEDVDFVERDDRFVLVADRPFTIVHLLSSYTINMPDSQLPL